MAPLIPLLIVGAGAAFALVANRVMGTPKPVVPAPNAAGGGTAVVPVQPPPPAPGSGVVPAAGGGTGVIPIANTTAAWRLVSDVEFTTLANDARAASLIEDTAHTGDLAMGQPLWLILTPDNGQSWIAAPANMSVTAPNPTATIGGQVAGGPAQGTAFVLTDNDAYLDPTSQALPQFLSDHGQGNPVATTPGQYA